MTALEIKKELYSKRADRVFSKQKPYAFWEQNWFRIPAIIAIVMIVTRWFLDGTGITDAFLRWYFSG